MSIFCLMFAALLAATSCPPTPPAVVAELGEARLLRPDVEGAITVTNDALSAADEPFRVVESWQLNGRGLKEDEIVVYLVKSPASPESLARQRKEFKKTIAAIGADFSGINEGAEDCGDLDDCVETLYPETTVDLVMEVLNRQNAWELAKTSPECRCIVLMEHDLQLYQTVFGADWDRYMLLTLYDSAEDLQAALAANRLPDALLDGESVPLGAMITFLLLHEIGHHSELPLHLLSLETPPDLTLYLEALPRNQLEELRADGFVARVLATRCFGQNPTGLLLDTCNVPVALSMLTFVVGLKGKSKEARCLRYLDAVPNYPNWQARFILLNRQYVPDSASGQWLLLDYLSTRRQILEQPWVDESATCRRGISISRKD